MGEALDVEALRVEEQVTVARSPEELYDMVADLSRMGEWSPSNRGGRWDTGNQAEVGAVFVGVNVARDREYETRSEIVAARRPEEIAWVAGGATAGWARWGWRFEAVEGGTLVTESWDPVNLAALRPDITPEAAQGMSDRFRTVIEQTLAGFKAAAEGS